MKHGVFYSNGLSKSMRQVSKTIARKVFENGGEVYLLASNMRFDNMWMSPMLVKKEGQQYDGYTFDQIVNNYMCYNCDSVRGRYPNYFVEL